jgi:hypothetical protein
VVIIRKTIEKRRKAEKMKTKNRPSTGSGRRFPKDILERIHKEKILGLRAGADSTHRIIGIWVVVVEGRVFVRSWSLKPRSWWRTFLEDPYGIITVGETEIPVRAIQTRSERLKDLVSAAYQEKYNTPGSVKFVEDMSREPSRDTTTELVPLQE